MHLRAVKGRTSPDALTSHGRDTLTTLIWRECAYSASHEKAELGVILERAGANPAEAVGQPVEEMLMYVE